MRPSPTGIAIAAQESMPRTPEFLSPAKVRKPAAQNPVVNHGNMTPFRELS